MSKIIIFSRVFPSYHPKSGEETFFVEKILKGLINNNVYPLVGKNSLNIPISMIDKIKECEPKYHTIRAGNRWKDGDKFSPRVWSGKPYRSKQIIIAPDIEIKKIWNIEIKNRDFYLCENEGCLFDLVNSISPIKTETLGNIANNDGLELMDFLAWFQFPKPFKGQIICWNGRVVNFKPKEQK